MERATVAVLAMAATTAFGAAWIAKNIVRGPRQVETIENTVGATHVLVATTNINLGDSVNAQDLKWQQWPQKGVTPGPITRSANPDATTKLTGAAARAPFSAGEPIKVQKVNLDITIERDLSGLSELLSWLLLGSNIVTGSYWAPDEKPLSEDATTSAVMLVGGIS